MMFKIVNGITVDLANYTDDVKLIENLSNNNQFIADIASSFEREFSMADEYISGDEILDRIVEERIKTYLNNEV